MDSSNQQQPHETDEASMMPAALMMMGATPSSMDPQSMTTSAFMPDVDGNTDAQALSLSVNAALSAESTALADAQVTDESATDKICALNQPSSSSSSSLASHSTIADEGGQSSQSSGITNDYLAALKAAVAEEAPHNLRTPPATPGNREFTSDPSAVVDSMGVLFSAATEALGTKAQDEQTLHNLQQHQQQHQQHVQQQQDREHQDLQLSWGTSTEASAAAAAFYAATSVAHQPENAQHFAAAALSLADASNLAYSMVSGNPDFVPHHGQHSQSASILSEMQQALQQQQMHLQHQHMIQQQQAQHMLMQQQQQQQAHMIAPASVMGMDPLSAKRSLDATNAMTGGEPAQKKYIRAPPQVRKTQFKGKSSMMETPCKCKTCGGFVGKFHFHGPGDLLLATKWVDFECQTCIGDKEEDAHSGDSKEAALLAPLVPADKESLVCFLCTKTIGSGCILVKKANSDFGSSQPPAPSLSDSGSSSAILSLPEDFEAPQFITQVMCDVCDVKYKFCSQCGGGSIRTGKYRPTELFDNGRKTCSLAHVRLGDYINDFELLDITDGMSEDKYSALLSEMKNMHREFLLGFNAVPEMMEKPEWPLKEFMTLDASTHATSQELFSYLRKQLDPSKSKRFLALAFVNEEKKTGYRSPFSGFPVPFDMSQIEEGVTYTKPRVLAGFSVLEWDRMRGILLLNSQVLRAMNRRSTLDQDLLSLLVRRCLEDQMVSSRQDPTMMTPRINHIWTMIRHEHARFLMHAARMGFVERSLHATGDQSHILEHQIQLSDQQKRLFSELIVSVDRFQQIVKAKMKPNELMAWEASSLIDFMQWKRHNR